MFDLRPVGQTSLAVTSLGFGCASIGNLGHAVSDAETRRRCWRGRGTRASAISIRRRIMGAGGPRRGWASSSRARPGPGMCCRPRWGKVLRPGAQVAEADGFVDPLPNSAHYEYTAAALEEALEGLVAAGWAQGMSISSMCTISVP